MSTVISVWLSGIAVGYFAALVVEFIRPTIWLPEDTAALVLWPITVPLAIAFVVAEWIDYIRR